MAEPAIAVVIVNYRTAALTLAALAALCGERERLPGLRAMIVDGGSGDDSVEQLRAGIADRGWDDWVRLLPLAVNGGFGWANNQAMLTLLQSDNPPDYLHLLNPDTRIEPGAVGCLAGVLDRHPECAVAASLLLNEDGSPSGSAFRFPSIAREFDRGARTAPLARWLGIAPVLIADAPAGAADWVTGASMMIRATALREVGLFDSGFFLYFEEVELMARLARAGWSIRHEPSSRVCHIGGAATGKTYQFADLRVAPPLPAYWFHSRRRLLVQLYGTPGAIAAGGAWLAGHALFLLRRALGRAGGHVPTRREARDLLRHGFLPVSYDRQPAITRWNDPPGQPPAWIAWAKGGGA